MPQWRKIYEICLSERYAFNQIEKKTAKLPTDWCFFDMGYMGGCPGRY